MLYFMMGDVIRDARLRHKLTQEDLAFGICSVSTLSKIENKSRVPHYGTFEALMQRMGEPGNMYISYVGPGGLERKKLLYEMERQLWQQNIEKVRELLGEYRMIAREEELLELQERRTIEAVLKYYRKAPISEIYIDLAEALAMTRPDFNGTWNKNALYTHNELLILQMIAECYQKMGRRKEAHNILQELLNYQKHIFFQDAWTEEMELSVYYQLAELYYQAGEYTRSASFSIKGIQRCLLLEKYHFMPRLLIQRAYIMAELGDMKECHLAEFNAGLLRDILTNQKYLSKFL